MDFREFIIEYDNVLSEELCDEIVSTFEADTSKSAGTTVGGETPDIKTSIDLAISPIDYPVLDDKIFRSFTKYAREYTAFFRGKLYPTSQPGDVTDSGYQVQRTDGSGFYTWHHDSYSMVREYDEKIHRYTGTTRYATYIFYLNDYDAGEENGGRTQFYLDGDIISIYPKKGKLLMFPANQLFVHRGEELKSGTKYIMTGWLSSEAYHGIE